MMDFLRRHRQKIFLFTVAGFLAGIFVGFGGYFFSGRSSGDAVAEVNGNNIPYRIYYYLLNQYQRRIAEEGTELTPERSRQLRQEVLAELIREEILYQEAQRLGLQVTDRELAADIRRFPAFPVRDKRGQDGRAVSRGRTRGHGRYEPVRTA